MRLALMWLFGWIIEGVLVGITLALTYAALQKSQLRAAPERLKTVTKLPHKPWY